VAFKVKHVTILDTIITRAHFVMVLSFHSSHRLFRRKCMLDGWLLYVAFKNIAAVLMV